MFLSKSFTLLQYIEAPAANKLLPNILTNVLGEVFVIVYRELGNLTEIPLSLIGVRFNFLISFSFK